jgi:phenylacetate-CoA ligase
VIVEILRDGRPAAPGERGEVVATGLHSFAMPFVRYRLGDLAIRGPERCPCGAPFTTIASLEGRVLDYLPLPGGRRLHPYELITRFVRDPACWTRRYRIEQDRIDRVTLRIVPTRTPTAEDVAALRGALAPVLGDGVEIDVAVVPEIPDEPSGKVRLVRSRVPLPS